MPVRVRVEERNSLNNRFKADPLITNRAMLSLDDDLFMTCNDIEHGFSKWVKALSCSVGLQSRAAESLTQCQALMGWLAGGVAESLTQCQACAVQLSSDGAACCGGDNRKGDTHTGGISPPVAHAVKRCFLRRAWCCVFGSCVSKHMCLWQRATTCQPARPPQLMSAPLA